MESVFPLSCVAACVKCRVHQCSLSQDTNWCIQKAWMLKRAVVDEELLQLSHCMVSAPSSNLLMGCSKNSATVVQRLASLVFILLCLLNLVFLLVQSLSSSGIWVYLLSIFMFQCENWILASGARQVHSVSSLYRCFRIQNKVNFAVFKGWAGEDDNLFDR